MKKFLQVLGVLFILVLLGAGGLLLFRKGPDNQQVVKADNGVKIATEPLSFYIKDRVISGQVYHLAVDTTKALKPAVVYCQAMEYGNSWCQDIAAQGLVAYCFDFTSPDLKTREKELKEVVKQVGALRYVDASRVFVLGEGNGCHVASVYTFNNAKKVAGLMLLSPGFNPLELSYKAKHYKGQVLVIDETLGHKAAIAEMLEYIKP
ncbi:MAG: hypothetical protein J5769_06240 [Bacteroidales bacterium]|nr:hypothetical protein [Bacteroidales bacterium]